MFLLRRLSRHNHDFYELLGPVFGSREIAKQVGIHVYDDEDKAFYVAEADGLRLAGLVSSRAGLVSDCYVFPEFRRRGALRALLTFATLEPRDYRANCTAMSIGAFLEQGFTPVRVTKNFTYVEKKNA